MLGFYREMFYVVTQIEMSETSLGVFSDMSHSLALFNTFILGPHCTIYIIQLKIPVKNIVF